MVEVDIHLKLLPTSILDICKVFEHSYAVHRHRVVALHSYTALVGPGFSLLSNLWNQNHVITSWWWLTATSISFPHPYLTCKKCLSTFICCPFIPGLTARLKVLASSQFGSKFWHWVERCIHYQFLSVSTQENAFIFASEDVPPSLEDYSSIDLCRILFLLV
jgi:hypothetical protein